MVNINGRILHYVFRIPERGRTMMFYRDVLGMKVLRHEEFAEGCEAGCNGPYESRWSKTMVGYGPEDAHFIMELTFNYPIHSYDLGNDFIGITIQSREALTRAKSTSWPILPGNVLEAPGGYKFFIIDQPQPADKDPVQKVTLASTNLNTAIEYWTGILGLQLFQKNEEHHSAHLGFNAKEAHLELQQIDGPINYGTAQGRIGFSCPHDQLPIINELAKRANAKILVPMKSLDTPGKPTVVVIILADPDGHEICMVDDEGFRLLSQYQPEEEAILNRFIEKDETGQLKKQDDKRQEQTQSSKQA